MCDSSTNLRYLLWKNEVAQAKWVEQLAQWASCDVHRAQQLLEQEDPLDEEWQRIGQSLKLNSDESMSLRYANLVELYKVDVLKENISFLIKQWEELNKTQTELAEQAGVNSSTVSRWIKGKKPKPKTLPKICKAFGLSENTDLEKELLFLSLDPIGAIAQKVWLQKQINLISNQYLQKMFPALKKLLSD